MKAGQQGQGGAGDGMKCVANGLKQVSAHLPARGSDQRRCGLGRPLLCWVSPFSVRKLISDCIGFCEGGIRWKTA